MSVQRVSVGEFSFYSPNSSRRIIGIPMVASPCSSCGWLNMYSTPIATAWTGAPGCTRGFESMNRTWMQKDSTTTASPGNRRLIVAKDCLKFSNIQGKQIDHPFSRLGVIIRLCVVPDVKRIRADAHINIQQQTCFYDPPAWLWCRPSVPRRN